MSLQLRSSMGQWSIAGQGELKIDAIAICHGEGCAKKKPNKHICVLLQKYCHVFCSFLVWLINSQCFTYVVSWFILQNPQSRISNLLWNDSNGINCCVDQYIASVIVSLNIRLIYSTYFGVWNIPFCAEFVMCILWKGTDYLWKVWG